jgi:hypothetical protein
MVSLATGTWSGTPTHDAGFVKGNGTTAYFTSEINPSGAGFTTATGGVFFLLKTAPSGTGFAAHFGPSLSTTERVQCYHNSNSIDAFIASGNSGLARWTSTRADQTGIIFADRSSLTRLDIFRRNTAGFSSVAQNIANDPGTIPTQAFSFMAQGSTIPSDGEYGIFGVTLGMDSSNAQALTLNLKTLWEGITGLTLP